MTCFKCGKKIDSKGWNWGNYYDKTTSKLQTFCHKCHPPNDHKFSRAYRSTVAAIYEDDKGREIAVDQRGNVMSDNPYEGDPHGWRRAGKKIQDRRVIFK